MEVQVINKSNHRLPEYAKPGDAGMDLKANIDTPITIRSLEHVIIPTGLHVAIPEGYEIQVRGRSGLAAKYGIVAHLGTIDSGYRNDVGVILFNLSNTPFVVNPGERIGQAVLKKVETIEWNEVKELPSSERGEGGFGSTGLK